MKHFNENDIEHFSRHYRSNLMSSIVGIKQANLIGTVGRNKISNLAIFSSAVHIGSNPALLGIFCKPGSNSPKQTLENIFENKEFTINQVRSGIINKSHATHHKFLKDNSEFSKCNLTEYYLNDFMAPFVEEAYVKIGLSYSSRYLIEENNVFFIIGKVKHIIVKNSNYISDNGELELAKLGSIGVSGNNSYYSLLYNKTLEYINSSNKSLLNKIINENS